MEGIWSLLGYDTFEGEFYPIEGEYLDEVEIRRAAKARLEKLEETQPSEESGGQGAFGIQDLVYIVRPDGSRYRYLTVPFSISKN